jgi:alkaline phosphatase D
MARGGARLADEPRDLLEARARRRYVPAMKRREFLRNTGWFVVGASLIGLPACGDDNKGTPGPDGGTPGPGSDGGPQPEPAGTYSFPQGVASGDPQATSVVLWTRAVRVSAAAADVALLVQVSATADFATFVVNKPITATSASDHTVRVLVNGLQADASYYYRFVAGTDVIPGRTRTAPDPAADVQINFAWVSCQDFGAGNYGAYRQMLIDDAARADADKIHAVVHLGDMIYETRAKDFQTAINEKFETISIVNRDGTPRGVAEFPSGGGTRAGAEYAKTLDDYRHLYKTFLSDPDIQAARARWPFIAVWDDHEFTDDCWQSQANYTDAASLDEGDQSRKVAGSQAWFEFVPSHLTGAAGVAGVASQAKDFAAPATAVVDAPMTDAEVNADNFTNEPNNAAAVGAMTIYRSLRFGKHVELVMTDQRSYRSDHAIPEDFITFFNKNVAPAFFAPRNVVPQSLCDLMDAGAAAQTPKIPVSATMALDNPRANSPIGTMLGKAQKAWWKDTMLKSDATWKLWGSEVTFMRLRVPALDQPGQPDISPRVVSADAWDGYSLERKELMAHVKGNNIQNLLVLSGDIHSSWAGIVLDDYDPKGAAVSTPVANELVAAGISSNSFFSFVEAATPAASPLRPLVIVNASDNNGQSEFTENLNLLIKCGLKSAGAFAQTHDLPTALSVSVNTNPHLKYIDTNAQGYGYVKVTAALVTGVITTIQRPIKAPTDAGPGVLRTATFTIPAGNPGGMSDATFTGTKPFPLT